MLAPIGQSNPLQQRPDAAEPEKVNSQKVQPLSPQQKAAIHRQRVRQGLEQCQTCASRTYIDGSNDPSVSFKIPTHVSPGNSYAAVRAHEGEHVANEKARAQQEDMRIVSQTVSTYSANCPECGRMYTAGGVTRTIMKSSPQPTGNRLDAYA